MNESIAEFEDFNTSELDICLRFSSWGLELQSVFSIEHENFWVLNLSVGEEESLLAESASTATSSNMNVELSLRHLFELKVNLLEAL